MNFEGVPGTKYDLEFEDPTGEVHNAVGATYRATVTWTNEGPAERLPDDPEPPDEPHQHEFWVGDDNDLLTVRDSLLISFSETPD